MKVYLCASPRGYDEFGKYYKMIFDTAQKLGYTLVDDQIVNGSYKSFHKQMAKGAKEYINLYKREVEGVEEADINIFESSVHSSGLGFLIHQSLEQRKPTIVIYFDKNTPYFLAGAEDEKLIVHQYNEKNLVSVLTTALMTARDRRDKRFNFFISPKLLEYLETTSKKEGITKSKFIRNLIINHMKSPAA